MKDIKKQGVGEHEQEKSLRHEKEQHHAPKHGKEVREESSKFGKETKKEEGLREQEKKGW